VPVVLHGSVVAHWFVRVHHIPLQGSQVVHHNLLSKGTY
jgi:hypothetical protein